MNNLDITLIGRILYEPTEKTRAPLLRIVNTIHELQNSGAAGQYVADVDQLELLADMIEDMSAWFRSNHHGNGNNSAMGNYG